MLLDFQFCMLIKICFVINEIYVIRLFFFGVAGSKLLPVANGLIGKR